MRASRSVHVVVPGGIDDPARPSGGNRYDRRICDGLPGAGWAVRELSVGDGWPRPGPAQVRLLAWSLARVPDGAVTLVDGLVGCRVPALVAAESRRLRVVVLVHLPLGVAGDAAARADERAALAAAAGVVATSDWTRRWLAGHYGLTRIGVAEPGVDPAPLATGTPGGGRVLCVGAVSAVKGQDLLVAALGRVADLPWTCEVVGSLGVDQGFAARIRREAPPELGARLRFPGVRAPEELDAAYAAADLVVVPSRVETYGMVAAEALARGIPVLATAVGGLPATLAGAPLPGAPGATTTPLPGILVPAEDPDALAAALRTWLGDPAHRASLRAAAAARRRTLTGWDVTCRRISRILESMGEHP